MRFAIEKPPTQLPLDWQSMSLGCGKPHKMIILYSRLKTLQSQHHPTLFYVTRNNKAFNQLVKWKRKGKMGLIWHIILHINKLWTKRLLTSIFSTNFDNFLLIKSLHSHLKHKNIAWIGSTWWTILQSIWSTSFEQKGW